MRYLPLHVHDMRVPMHDVYVVMLYYKLYLHTGATAHTCNYTSTMSAW